MSEAFESQIEKLKADGLFGCVEDPMWNGKIHECCGSPRAYYHKKGCRLCTAEPELQPQYMKSMKNDAGNTIRFNKHIKRKNNDLVAAMYAMYCLPRSLRYVAREYKRTNQAVHGMFVSRGYMLRSKQFRGLQILDGIRFTETKGGHLRGTVSKDHRIMMHQYVWQKAHGEIPPGFCIWHKDRNPANNSLENLEAIPKSLMSKYFNPNGKNQHTKTIKAPEEVR